ncbi:hypothetical protein GCM10009756_26630 [Pseudokineococcus marinus]
MAGRAQPLPQREGALVVVGGQGGQEGLAGGGEHRREAGDGGVVHDGDGGTVGRPRSRRRGDPPEAAAGLALGLTEC